MTMTMTEVVLKHMSTDQVSNLMLAMQEELIKRAHTGDSAAQYWAEDIPHTCTQCRPHTLHHYQH